MSGSYDRPPGPPYPLPPPQQPLRTRSVAGDSITGTPQSGPPSGHAPYHGGLPQPGYHNSPLTTDASRPYGNEPYAPVDDYQPQLDPPPDHELRADTQAIGASNKEPATAPVVPAGSVTGRSLTLVVSIMCFLACLTAGAVYMVNQAASAWLRDVASEITIQVEPRDGVDANKLVQDVAQFLQRQPGIVVVKPLSLEDSTALIEPWLGKTDALKSLPIPRMIAVELDRRSPPEMDGLRGQLASQFKGVALDDHRQWQSQIRTVTRSLALGGLAILMLVGAATTAIIISATRSAMASNREIVEVLHFVGATDRFIAREFEKHFLRLGVRAGIVGAVLAALVFLLLPSGMELLSGRTVSMADLKWMVGTGALDAPGYVVLVVVVVVIASLCMLTSRFGVYRILNGPH